MSYKNANLNVFFGLYEYPRERLTITCRRPAPSSRAADFYAWLRREPGRTTSEICRRFGYSGTYQLDNLLMECETCGLLLFEGELPPDGSGRPEVALFAMEGG